MSVFTVPFLAGAVLLVVAGASKFLSPDSTVAAAGSGGLPAATWSIRLLAGVEVVVGIDALVFEGTVPAALVALSYVGFAAFLTRGLVRGDLDSCGCFANDRGRPTPLHVVVDLAFAGCAVAAGLTSAPASLRSAISVDQGWATTLLVLVASGLGYVVLSGLPERGTVPERLRADTAGAV